MMKRLLLILMPAVLLLCSCQEDGRLISALEGNPAIRLELGGQTAFVYDAATCQLAFSRSDCSFRVHTDDMTDWFSVKMSAIPAAVDEELMADLQWTTESSVSNRKDVALRVVKLEGDKVWLWGPQGQVGLVVRILE